MTTAAANQAAPFLSLNVKEIRESKSNPRSHFDEGKMKELTESVREHGVLQPILVRGNGEGYEVVAGHRRLRAARAAGLPEIPAIIRDLDDKQVLEIQVIENLQREDLHPLEEAEGYQRLIKSYGYNADAIAEKIGKSRSYVYARMKLVGLCDLAKELLWKNVITESHALLIARIPDDKLQKEATKTIVYGEYGREPDPMSVREAADFIHEHYMLALSSAPWKWEDETLLPAAGPCTTCPFRTGNQQALFSDVKSPDVCTKPSCFRQKQDAWWERTKAEAMRAGQRVLTPTEAKKVINEHRFDCQLAYGSGYVDIDSKCYEDPKHRTYRHLLGITPLTGKDSLVVLARAPQHRKVFHLVAKPDLSRALKAAGHSFDRHAASATSDYDRKWKERQRLEGEKRALERQISNAITKELVENAPKVKLTSAVLRIVTKAIAFHNSWNMDDIIRRHAGKPARAKDARVWDLRPQLINDFIDKLKDGQMLGLVAELLFTFSPTATRSNAEKELAREFCKLLNVNASAIEKRIRAEAAAKKRAQAKAKKKPGQNAKRMAKQSAAKDP